MTYDERVKLSEDLIERIEFLIKENNVEIIYKDFEYDENHHDDFLRLIQDNIVTIIKETI